MKKLILSIFIPFGLVGSLFADDNIILDSNSSNEQIEQEHNKTEIEIIDEECKKSVSSFYAFIHLDGNSTTEINKMYQDCIDKKLKGIEYKEKKIKEEQERQKAAEEYIKHKKQKEQAKLSEVNEVEANSSLETQNIDTNITQSTDTNSSGEL